MAKKLKRRTIDKTNVESSVTEDEKKHRDEQGITYSEWDDTFIENAKKRLREKGQYCETYNDFMDNEDGVYIERNEYGGHTVHVRANSPQEAMDKLKEMGLLTEEEAEMFKQFYDELEASGVDFRQIKGGNLALIRDEKTYESYRNELIKKFGGTFLDGNGPDVSVQENELNQDGPDVQVGKLLSDQDLLVKLADIEVEAGLSGPDVQVGKNYDLEMGS